GGDACTGPVGADQALGVVGLVGSGWAGLNGCGPVGRVGSKVTWVSLSFVAQGADGVEAGGLACRPDAEHDPDREAEQDGRDDGHGVEDEAPAGELADARRDDEAEDDADEAAEER